MPMCKTSGCKKFAEKNSEYCSLQHKQFAQTISDKGAVVMVEVKRINGNGYYGGGADEPHVHVYAKGCHLKLGADRYNLVQGGKKYSGKVAEAYEALKGHALGNTLKPWVAAALVFFRV